MTDAEREAQIRQRIKEYPDGIVEPWDAGFVIRLLDEARAETARLLRGYRGIASTVPEALPGTSAMERAHTTLDPYCRRLGAEWMEALLSTAGAIEQAETEATKRGFAVAVEECSRGINAIEAKVRAKAIEDAAKRLNDLSQIAEPSFVVQDVMNRCIDAIRALTKPSDRSVAIFTDADVVRAKAIEDAAQWHRDQAQVMRDEGRYEEERWHIECQDAIRVLNKPSKGAQHASTNS